MELLVTYQMLTEIPGVSSLRPRSVDDHQLRGWELAVGELVAVSLTGFVEGCHDRVDNSGRALPAGVGG